MTDRGIKVMEYLEQHKILNDTMQSYLMEVICDWLIKQTNGKLKK